MIFIYLDPPSKGSKYVLRALVKFSGLIKMLGEIW